MSDLSGISKKDDRIAMLQGGGIGWRWQYGSGELMACGYISEENRDFRSADVAQYNVQYLLVKKYYPPQKPGNELVGTIFYSLKRAKQSLPKEKILARSKNGNVPLRPMKGQKFIEVTTDDPGYHILDQWWCENCSS